MKILEELWYGNIAPSDRTIPRGSQLHRLGELVVRHEDELSPLLSDKAKEVYEKLQDCQSELHELTACDIFCIGFRLGAKITYEVMDAFQLPSVDD